MQKSIAASLLFFVFLPLALAGLPGQAAGKTKTTLIRAGAAAGQTPLLQTASAGQGFTLTAEISGEISYFAGQTNLAGRKIPLDNKRFLGGEMLRLKLRFAEWPARFSLDLAGRVQHYNGINGCCYYEWILPLSDLPETLDWAGNRQNPAWSLTIQAWSASQPQQELSIQFSGLEMTGDIWDLVQTQPIRP